MASRRPDGTFVSMKRAALVAAAASVAVIVGLGVLAIPAVVATWTAAAPIVQTAAKAVAASPPEPTGGAAAQEPNVPQDDVDPQAVRAKEVGCDGFPKLGWETVSPRPDKGPREYANGTVTFGADGGVATYTVAPGDSGQAIGERL